MDDVLNNFTQKDIAEQFAILDHIKTTGQTKTVPRLFELLAGKKCEQATHEMIYHTLFHLMKDDEKSIRAGILHPSFRVKLLSIRSCRKSGITAATPELIQTLQTSEDMEIIGEIIMTLGSFKDPILIPILRPYLFHTDPSVVSWTMESLAGMENNKFAQILQDLISSDESLDSSGRQCNLSTILALEHLGKLGDGGSRKFLLSLRNHPNTVFRKAVDKALQALHHQS